MSDTPPFVTAPDASRELLAFDADGHPISPLYGDVYKSRHGAFAEAQSVFVDGARVRERWSGADRFTVLELGLGLGVNLLALIDAWRADPRRPARLHLVSVEAHLLPVDALRRAHAALGLRSADAEALAAQWPLPLPGLHRLWFAQGAVSLTVAIGEASRIVPKLALAADAFFLDGFSPARNPAMWSAGLIKSLARLARHGATLASYTAAAPVREALTAAGFEVRRAPGFAGKRERIAAVYAPRWRTFPPPPPAPHWSVREAIVVGAGIAGCSVACALAERGWRVTVLERNAGPFAEGSSQPALADHLHVSPDDNLLARLSRGALLFRAAARSEPPPFSGKLQLADDPDEAQRQHAMVESLAFPERFLRSLTADEASDVAGVRLARGGLWLPMCGQADPRAQQLDASDGIHWRWNSAVDALRFEGGLWSAFDASGRLLARAPVVLLANASEATRLAGMTLTGLRRVRGQTTLLAAGLLPGLRTVLGGPAYACPLPDGRVLVGSTYDDQDDPRPDPQSDLSNVRRLRRMLAPAVLPADDALSLVSGPIGFRCAARDRLPLIGAIPDEVAARAQAKILARDDRQPLPMLPGVYGAFGFGSRGRLWSRLAAGWLADHLDGAPLPLERDLCEAIAPYRMLRQAIRTGRLR